MVRVHVRPLKAPKAISELFLFLAVFSSKRFFSTKLGNKKDSSGGTRRTFARQVRNEKNPSGGTRRTFARPGEFPPFVAVFRVFVPLRIF